MLTTAEMEAISPKPSILDALVNISGYTIRIHKTCAYYGRLWYPSSEDLEYVTAWAAQHNLSESEEIVLSVKEKGEYCRVKCGEASTTLKALRLENRLQNSASQAAVMTTTEQVDDIVYAPAGELSLYTLLHPNKRVLPAITESTYEPWSPPDTKPSIDQPDWITDTTHLPSPSKSGVTAQLPEAEPNTEDVSDTSTFFIYEAGERQLTDTLKRLGLIPAASLVEKETVEWLAHIETLAQPAEAVIPEETEEPAAAPTSFPAWMFAPPPTHEESLADAVMPNASALPTHQTSRLAHAWKVIWPEHRLWVIVISIVLLLALTFGIMALALPKTSQNTLKPHAAASQVHQTSLQPTSTTVSWVVREGDVLGQVAQDTGTTISALQKLNHIDNTSFLAIDQKLQIPMQGINLKNQVIAIGDKIYLVKLGTVLFYSPNADKDWVKSLGLSFPTGTPFTVYDVSKPITTNGSCSLNGPATSLAVEACLK